MTNLTFPKIPVEHLVQSYINQIGCNDVGMVQPSVARLPAARRSQSEVSFVLSRPIREWSETSGGAIRGLGKCVELLL